MCFSAGDVTRIMHTPLLIVTHNVGWIYLIDHDQHTLSIEKYFQDNNEV